MRGLRDKDLLNFYRAAAAFYESSVWVGLSATQHREFFLSKPVKKDCTYSALTYDPTLSTDEDTVPASSTIGTPIFICGLQSASHQHYNGTRAEIYGRKCSSGKSSGRWPVRACSDGRVLNLKPTNIRIDTSMEKWGIVKVCGADGAAGGFICVYQAWGDLFSNRDPYHVGNPSHMKSHYLSVEFYDPNELVGTLNPAIVRQHKKLGAPLADCRPFMTKEGDLRNVFFPVVSGLFPEDGGRFCAADLKLLEAALLSATIFLRDHLYRNRIPPAPHPNGYTFAPTTTSVQLRDQLTCVCSFPHGELKIEHRKWTSYPQSCRYSARRPPNVKTIQQAMDFHESQVSTLKLASSTEPLDNQMYAIQLYALANSLWESEVLENVVRAKDIAKRLFDHSASLRSEVCDFLLDLLLELGEWEDAVLYLNKMPENHKETEVFMFSSALVWFRSRGAKSSSARKAMRSAMSFNKLCVPMMLSIDAVEMTPTAGVGYFFSVSRNSDGTINSDSYKKPNAREYVRNNKKHWVLDGSSLSFLQEMYDEMETTTKKKKKKKKKNKKSKNNQMTPSISKTLCAACGKFSKADETPKKCGRCRSVSYCNASCQKMHWKEHKPVCKKLCEEV